MQRIYLIILSIVLSSSIVLLDLWSKSWATIHLMEWEIPLIGSFITLNLHHNSGIAFSLPILGSPLLIITTLLLIGVFARWTYLFWRYFSFQKEPFIEIIALSMILGGGLGNGYERFVQWYVIDFIDISYFAICNIADIFISLGAILYIILSFLTHDRD